MVGIIVGAVVLIFLVILFARTVRVVPQAKAGIVERLRALPAHPEPRADRPDAVRRPAQAADRPARAGRLVPAPAGDHRGQPRGRDRHGPVLHRQRPEVGHLRGRQPAAGDRADHGHDPAQRDRLADARGSADQPRSHQRPAATRARRGHQQVGDPRQPRRDQVDRSARLDPGGDGEADARRARPARRDPQRRGRQAVPDPHGRGPEAGRRAHRRGCRQAAILRAEGEAKAIETVFAAIHDGRVDPELLSYQYLQMLPQLAQGRRQQGVRDPVGVRRGVRRHQPGVHQRARGRGAQPELARAELEPTRQ